VVIFFLFVTTFILCLSIVCIVIFNTRLVVVLNKYCRAYMIVTLGLKLLHASFVAVACVNMLI